MRTEKEIVHFAGSPDSPSQVDTGAWEKVDYTYDDNERKIVIDRKLPPFDGRPVLISTPDGMMEARWRDGLHKPTPPSQGDDDLEGVCWAAEIGRYTYAVHEVSFWMPSPRKIDLIPAEQLPEDHENFLVSLKNGGWVEGWYHQKEGLWNITDYSQRVRPDEVEGYMPLPVLNEEIEAALMGETNEDDRPERAFYRMDV